ncbi:23S rRNA (uracil(1939)-C(5))-methyltransferase RlmD [Actinobacillus seminis]|uniref:23S rRNA (uracil(1939)-C(5))-methyltransferase RlmD n=1 Tax=Actinobacillus seminis TaxID=722 RepID=UPI003B92549F
MVLLYTPKKQAKKALHFEADIVDLDYQGFGVAKVGGKTWFIENALPQERVMVASVEEKRQFGMGKAQRILRVSALRQTPKCPYYQQCGGCQSQHIPLALQRESKQKNLFQRLSCLQAAPIDFQPMMVGAQWHYRRRVRLSLRYEPKTRQLVMGFRQKRSADIVNIRRCEVLVSPLNELLEKVTALLAQWSTPKQLGHVELVAADNGVAMLLRYMQNMAEIDRTLLLRFAQAHQLMLFVQDDYEIKHVYGEFPYYQLKDGTRLYFDIRDFIQVNASLNQQMIDTALDWLALSAQDEVLDLFCGMGNFTLPLSKRVKSAVGIEGVSEMVVRARQNAEQNHCHNVQFYQSDLEKPFIEQPWARQQFNKILLDPARGGAAFALSVMMQVRAEKILYVSCNPATLVRDAAILLEAGYLLRKVAMVDMFPNTAHLESISLFEKTR